MADTEATPQHANKPQPLHNAGLRLVIPTLRDPRVMVAVAQTLWVVLGQTTYYFNRDPVQLAAAIGTGSWSRAVSLVSGSNTITARATDVFGNTAQVSVTVTVNLPLISNIAAGSGKTYQLGTLAVGELLYIDRSWTFSVVPAMLAGQEYISTAHLDRNRGNANDLTFTLTQDARVYVLYDDRVTTLPAWLDDGAWTLDSITVDTTDGLRRVYHRDFLSGTVQLGGNAMSPMSGARRNYNVVAVP